MAGPSRANLFGETVVIHYNSWLVFIPFDRSVTRNTLWRHWDDNTHSLYRGIRLRINDASSRNVTMLKYVFVLCLNQHKPFAFKNLMIHGVLHFTLRFAFCCVLHRCENQDIRC